MIKNLFIKLLFIGLLLIQPAFAQNKNQGLNKDPEKFIEKIEGLFDNVSSETQQAIVEKFIENWEEKAFAPEEQNLIFEIDSLMDKNRYRPTNGYSTYLKALNASRVKRVNLDKFKEWHRILRKMADNRRNFNQINEKLTHFFKTNKIYESGSKDWKISEFNYNLKYDNKPYLLIENPVNLSCITKGDTLKIYNTTGKLDMLENKWVGDKGKITWERVALAPNKVYANFNQYQMALKSGELKVSEVDFYNKNLFDKPLEGKIHDKVYFSDKGKNARFPKFFSKKNTHHIDGFFENLTYIGGFTMKGRKVIGTGTGKQKAKFKIYYNGNLQLVSKSQRFLITNESIDASPSKSIIYLKNDSIYHSNIKFKYLDKNTKVTLSKMTKGLGQGPFYNSYHDLEINVDVMEWNIKKPFLTMRMTLNSVESANFRSANFYDKGKFQKVQGILEQNPLNQIYQYAKRSNTKKIKDQKAAQFLGIPLNNMRKTLVRLSNKGFINYYLDKGEFVIQDKLTHYIKANKDLKDFDNIVLNSKTGNNKNARLNLNSGELKLKGVKSIPLSEKQNVRIYPRNRQLKVLENRNMKFKGQMTAGRFHYFGNNFSFNYDSFKIDMKNIDSMMIYYPDETQEKLVQVKNVLQDISGSVLIDHPNNKSGKANLSKFPIFDCRKESAVYYEKPSIFNNVYKKDSFYFQVKPFVVDSLDNFSRKGIKFKGTFYSANIFPVFDHYLTLMKDNSLGFTKRTPDQGYPLYGGKGTGYLQIKLSNQGLWGKGKVNYLTSKTESQNFIFFPDSMNSHSESFSIPEKGQNKYPPVTSNQVYNHWMPYKDSMYINEKEPLSVYQENVKFEGDLILTPKDLYGTGIIKFDRAVIGSKALAMRPNNIETDSAKFKLKSKGKGKPSFLTRNTSLNLDLANKTLTGSSNTKKAKINLKNHQYQTSIGEYTWNIEEENVYMKSPPDQSIEDAFMLSTDPAQDSLKFNTTAAYFDLEKSIIEAKNIPHINIADAQVYPNNGEVTIKKNSRIKTLRNAKIRADTSYFFHDFYDATINIISQNEYGAQAKYSYEDRNGDKDTIIFDEIRVDAKNRTVASGTIEEESQFNLSPRFRFEGQVGLKARRQELAFNGLVFPENVKPSLRTEKMQFADTVYPDSIYININDATNENGKRLYTGIYLNKRENKIYNLFLGRKKNPRDYPIFRAKGHLHYSYYTGKYIINKWENIKGNDKPLHKFTYSDQDNSIKTTGDINFNFENENVDLKVAGNITDKPSDTSHSFDLVMGLDFNFDPEAMNILADSISNLAFYRPDTRDSREMLRKVIPNLIKNKEAQNKVLNSLKDFDMMVTNEAYQPNFLFTQLNLRWSPRRKAFIKKENSNIGLGNVKSTSINKQLLGQMEFQTGTVPDHLKFYLSSNKNNYYYFNIGKEQCKVFSSDYKFKRQVNSTAGDFSKGDFEIKVLKDGKEKLFFQRSF